jgi:hypothetical protein
MITALASFAVGIWAMSKTFKTLFNPKRFENITASEIAGPHNFILFQLLFKSTRKKALFILLWYFSGFSIMFLIYKILEILLLSHG